ncbi:Rhodanese domain-containing protein [Trichostrongylus colubriformis]|uniref:Rhodanese domain-containing protein n=1 Tax=Trichostrongylus colubriformis TaxID=6319 RepID=A0AAN8FSL8_TRICO
MLLAGETYLAIDIHKLVRFLILRHDGKATPLGDFIIVDINDPTEYTKEHIITAEHYNRFMLSRNHFETPLLASARLAKQTLVIYGQSASVATATLHQRGYKVVHLFGNIPLYKTFYPKGLTSKTGSTLDINVLAEALQRKIDSDRGGRLWRSTSASRLRSVDNKAKNPVHKAKPPWKC